MNIDHQPIRLSVHEGDPGYSPYQELLRSGADVTVLLDGVAQELCVTADREQGWIRRFSSIGEPHASEVVKGSVAFVVAPRGIESLIGKG